MTTVQATTLGGTRAPTERADEVDAVTLRAWMESGKAALIDVRQRDEHIRERIAGATLVPLGELSAEKVPAGGTVVVHCKSGRRSAEAAARLRSQGRPVVQLKGGIDAWKSAGLPVETNARAPISIMRQVQVVVGSSVLAASVLAATVSPWFLVLTGFFGAGLLFAGATGTCGLAAVLGVMPWNRAFRGTGGCVGGSCGT